MKDTSEFTRTLYDYVIIPALEEEGRNYIEEFKNAPSLFLDDSCKNYSSNARFRVFLLPKNQR
uniref:Uncharacterized protein n=1 Tax=Chryseobacterium endophyticum TaxID=1854762 RepID=A0AAU6WP88_9FLAO